MPPIVCSITALAVACIFYTYRNYVTEQIRREGSLRERVTYLLWVVANTAK